MTGRRADSSQWPGWPRLVVLAAAVSLALLTPTAAPAAVFPLSANPADSHPDIAVDEAGTAHVVWERRVDTAVEHVVYCRVPRGGQACAASQTFAINGVADEAKVNLMPTGELVITTERFRDDPQSNDPHNKIYVIVSTDGGLSFSPPTVIANRAGTIWGWGGEVEPGPGNFSISALGNDGGCNEGLNYSSLPLDGMTTSSAELTDDCFKAFHPSLAFIGPTTPLAAYSDLDQIFYRRFAGAGDHNSLANWNPEVIAPFAGNEPRLAGGPRGVYLLYRDEEAPFDYWARPYDAQTNQFGKPTRISANDSSSAIFRDFMQDSGGTVHAAFLERPDGQTWELRHAILPPGKGWQAAKKLATQKQTADNFYNLRVGAGPDGGGGVVADSLGEGPIYFVSFPPSGGAASCPPQVKLGAAIARALDGCFAKRKGGKRVANGRVKVNGIDISPLAAGASAAAPFQVTVDPKARTLKTNKKALVESGELTLDKSQIGWKFPSGKGAVKRIGSADSTVFNQIEKFGKQLFDFPIKGDAELIIGAGETAKIPANLGLPELIGGVSGGVDFNTTAQGLNLDQLKIQAPDADIGLLRISNINVTYSGEDTFTGSATLSLPPAYGPGFDVGFGFKDGRFNFLHYSQPFSPMLPIVAPPVIGAPPEPLIGLERLGIDYVDEEGSRKFIGSVDIVGGGKYVGLRAAALEGNVTLEFPKSGPMTISAGGDLSVVEVPFATAKVAYSSDGLFSFDGSFEFPDGFPVIGGFVNGWVSVASPIRFSAAGGVEVFGNSGGEGVISSKGLTGCVNVNPDPTGLTDPVWIGLSYEWGDTFPGFSCENDSFKLPKPASAAAGAGAANATAAQIPGGLRQAALEISGAGGAPRVTITGPDGRAGTSGDGLVLADRYAMIEYPDAQKTYVTVGNPPAGSYAIETEAGSSDISEVRLARGLPAVKVAAKVSGKGAKRTLRYSLRKIAGQKVTFAEQSGGGLYREFASAKKAKGKIVFRPKNARATKRRIVALVEQNGIPRARLELGKYKAPKYRPAAKPRKLRVRRKRGKLVAGWKKVGGARGYRVLIALPKDGRRVLRTLKAKRTKLSLGGLEANDRGTIAVQAIGADARPGKAAKAKLKPKKRKKKKGKRRKGKRR